METKVITKQLAGSEDLLKGVGSVSQVRSTGTKVIRKLNVSELQGALVVDTIAEMEALVIADLGDTKTVIVNDNGCTYVYNGVSFLWERKTSLNVSDLQGALVVDTIAEMEALVIADLGDTKTVIVNDPDRGGVFYYDSDEAVNDNQGTNFNGWLRQYSGSVFVKWFGAKTDATDNTAIYTKIIDNMPEGTIIEWTPEAYTGDFISTKAFDLRGNGAVITPVTTFAFRFQGSLGNYNSLSVAPAHNDMTLSGVTGLTEDAYVLLYSGNERPSDGSAINYEVVKIKSDGTLYDRVYSDQNGGTPQYAIITPIDGVKVDGFTIEAGISNFYGVWIRYATNVQVSNIKMNGGSASTVACRMCLNVTVHHIQRIKPSATGSGQGYNIALNTVKYGKAYSIYDEECRHSYDQDSSYVMDISKVISLSCFGSAIALSHNSFGGYTTVKDCSVSNCNSYAVNISPQGLVSTASGLFRELVVDNVKISNTKDRDTYDFYVGVYMSIPTENVAISNITLENITSTTFDYPGAVYNTGYRAIRLYDPRENTTIKNINVDMATDVVFIDNITNPNANIDIDLININKYVSVIKIASIASGNIGRVTVSNLRPYESSSVYGRAIIDITEGTNRLRQLMVNGLYKINFYAKVIRLRNNTVGCPKGKIDTAGFNRILSSLNGLAEGGTITQNDYLTRGEFAKWGSTSKTLSTTEPIERPVTTGDRFAILNYGSGTLTIPGDSETVANTSDLLIEPGFLYEFQSNAAGNKWQLARKISGITLS